MEIVLKYLTQITLIGAAVSFVIGLMKWVYEKKLEREDKQYEYFHRMVSLASGTDETGRTIKMAQQVAAIYQLQRYKQYAFASVPVLRLLLNEMSDDKTERIDPLKKAINETIAKLS